MYFLNIHGITILNPLQNYKKNYKYDKNIFFCNFFSAFLQKCKKYKIDTCIINNEVVPLTEQK